MDSCPIKCPHEGHFYPIVSVSKDREGRFMAHIKLRCSDCNDSFEFQGVAPGRDPNGVRCSKDRKELYIAIATPATLATFYQKALEAILPPAKVIKPEFVPKYDRKSANQPRSANA